MQQIIQIQEEEPKSPIQLFFQRTFKTIKSNLCSFYSLTLSFVFFVSLIGGLSVYFLEKDFAQLKFIDAFFIVVSSATGCGLMSVDIYFLRTESQFIMTLCTEICCVCLASTVIPAYLRWYRLSSKKSKRDTELKNKQQSSSESEIDVTIITSEMEPYKYNYEIELKAIKYFAILSTIYCFGCQLLSFLILAINCNANSKTREALKNDGINPTFYALYITVSAWGNVGATITSSSFNIQDDPIIIIVMAVTCVMGLIGIPIGLRFMVFIFHRLFEKKSKVITTKNPLLYILKSPTRISNFLFSSTQTNLLIVIFFLLVALQSSAIVLWNRDESIEHIIFLAIAQASVTRTSGFTFLNFKKFHDVVSLIIIFTMFVGSYPIQMIRHFRDKQVNIQAGYFPQESNIKTIIHYFKDIIFSHTMIVFILSLIVMAIYSFENPEEHTALTVIFEVTSGFGTVGYSLGCPNCDNFSFSGVLPLSGKLVIIFSMFIGRVRGYPLQLYPPDYYDDNNKKYE